MKKTIALFGALVALLVSAFPVSAGDPFWLQSLTDDVHDIKVYRTASCSCCKGWISHLRDHNFRVENVVVGDVNPIKTQLGVPSQAASCHTAIVDGKIIEGHVPAQDIKSLLASKSDIHLLAVPGMPSGGPGMDTAGANKDGFKVYGVTSKGKVVVVSNYSDY